MRIAVVGAGVWGRALGQHLANGGHDALVVSARDPVASLPAASAGAPRFWDAVRRSDVIVSAVPSHATREVWRDAARLVPSKSIWVNVAKGIENETLLTMSELFRELKPDARIAVLSGPSFAAEVARGLPTAVVVASADEAVALEVQQTFAAPTFRVYTSTDMIGVELGGALKNVVAIAAGVGDGLGLGHNARAALITRGLAEIARLAIGLGANPLTLAGLSGLGDLVLTCTGELSRNRTLGFRLGRGESLDAVFATTHEAVEGVRTVKSVCAMAEREKVDMPIAQAVYRMLYEGLAPQAALAQLLGRELRAEL